MRNKKKIESAAWNNKPEEVQAQQWKVEQKKYFLHRNRIWND